jgi:N6-adenosine-specific RNA methylase IME4
MGTGKTTRKGKETVLLAKRGNGLKIVDHAVRQVIFTPPGPLSEKPQQIHAGLERLYGDARRPRAIRPARAPRVDLLGQPVQLTDPGSKRAPKTH